MARGETGATREGRGMNALDRLSRHLPLFAEARGKLGMLLGVEDLLHRLQTRHQAHVRHTD